MAEDFSIEEALRRAQHNHAVRRKARAREYTKTLAAQYPQAASALWSYYETVCLRLDSESRSKVEFLDDLEAIATQDKLDYWEILKIINIVDPNLPIVELHDQFCAEADAIIAKTREMVASLDAETARYRDAMINVVIAYHTGGHAAAQEEIDAFKLDGD